MSGPGKDGTRRSSTNFVPGGDRTARFGSIKPTRSGSMLSQTSSAMNELSLYSQSEAFIKLSPHEQTERRVLEKAVARMFYCNLLHKTKQISKAFHNWKLKFVLTKNIEVLIENESDFVCLEDKGEHTFASHEGIKDSNPSSPSDKDGFIQGPSLALTRGLSSTGSGSGSGSGGINSWKLKYFNKLSELKIAREKYATLEAHVKWRVLTRMVYKVKQMPLVYAMQKWKLVTSALKNDKDASMDKLRAQVMDQQRSSDIEELSECKNLNTKLNNNLMRTLYYFKWKVQNQSAIFKEERSRWISEKQSIRRDLIALRTRVAATNVVEKEGFDACTKRGLAAKGELQAAYDLLAKHHLSNS